MMREFGPYDDRPKKPRKKTANSIQTLLFDAVEM
jgi:hypothetical protein